MQMFHFSSPLELVYIVLSISHQMNGNNYVKIDDMIADAATACGF